MFRDLRGELVPFLRREDIRLRATLVPDEEAIVLGQAAGLAEIDAASLVQAGHHIDPGLGPRG